MNYIFSKLNYECSNISSFINHEVWSKDQSIINHVREGKIKTTPKFE